MIYVVNKKRKEENIKRDFPNAIILDVTSKSKYTKARLLSPFYPHGNIPIPNSGGATATCVEAVWQGLKVFENEGVDMETFSNSTMKNIKRTTKKFGKPKGHQFGLNSSRILNYYEARILIYLPTYKWMLDNIQEVKDVVNRIKIQSQKTDIVFLDYNTNIDYRNISSPISHAGLLKLYIEGQYPKPTIEDAPPAYKLEKTKLKTKNKTSKKDSQNNKTKKGTKKKKAEEIQPSLFNDLDF